MPASGTRDFSAGNLLLQAAGQGGGQPAIWLVDLNRSRELQVVSSQRRMADLSRLPLARAEHQAALLAAYCAPQPVAIHAQRLYRRQKQRFEARHRHKNALRTALARSARTGSRRAARSRTSPLPSREWRSASGRCGISFPISRICMPGGGRSWAPDLRTPPRSSPEWRRASPPGLRVRRCYRELTAAAAQPRTFAGLGVALRPWPRDPEALLAAVADLGVRHVLLRTHPWDEGASNT